MARLVPALLLALTAGWCGTFFGGATAFGSTAFLGLLLLVLFCVGARWQDPLRLGGLGSPLPLALWVAVALSQVSSPLPRAGRVAVVLLPALLWLPGVVERCWPWQDQRRHGLRAVSAVVGGIAAWAVLDALAHGGRAAMPLGHHNLLAAWMVTLLPLAALQALPAREKGVWRWLGLGSAVLAGAAVLASRSWLGAVALALQGTAVLILMVRGAPAAAASPVKRRWLLALGPLTLAALIATGLPRAERILSGTDPSAQARSVYAEAAWEGFQARPLQGWGPGTVPWTSALFLDPRPGVNPWGEAVGEFHSLPLHLLYEIGGAGLLLALLTGLLFCGERWTERAQARDRPLLLAALLGLAGAGVMALGSGALAVTALPVAVAVVAGAALAALPERELDLTFPVRIYAVLAGFALFPLVLAHWHYDRAVFLAALEAPERAGMALSRARDLDPEHPLYPMRLALLQAGETAPGEVDGAIARLARDAAEDSAVPGFWLIAGVLGQTAGEPWAAPVLETACALDPLNALPAWYLSLVRPGGEEAARAAGLALLAEPRLLAATAWEGQPERLAPALEEVRRWPGVDAGWKEALLAASGSVRRQGPTGFLQLEVDTVPALAASLHTFRRRPWPVVWPLVEVREAAAQRLELPPATTLPATSPAAVEAAGCRPAVGWPSTLITR